jgi:NAD(P)-dependent dehydrogenase (short-subunit alcohol dehydrogenase family)
VLSRIDSLFSLEGRVAIVTGAGAGMGARFAQTLAAAGARVICAARRQHKIERVAAGILAEGGLATAIDLDIGDTMSVRSVFDRAETTFGTVEILVNNAAQIGLSNFPGVEDAAWEAMVNVNLTGTMRMCREFSQRLIDAGRPGRIVNITSISGSRVMDDTLCYASTKAALNQLTRQLASDLAPNNIQCNAIAPGHFATAMVRAYFETDQGRKEINGTVAKRLAQVEELDGVLLLLTSDASSYINGAVIPVDGGHSIRLS